MIYDVVTSAGGTLDTFRTEIEIHEYPDNATPHAVNTFAIKTYRFYSQRETEDFVRYYNR